MSEREDEIRMILELEQLPDFHLKLKPFEAFVLLAQIQLALRHPGNSGQSATTAKRIALKLQYNEPETETGAATNQAPAA